VRDTVGGLIRGLIIVLALVLIVGIGVGGVWVLLRNNQPASSDSGGISIELGSLEQIALGIYLQMNQAKVDTPASSDPAPVAFTIEVGETPSTIATRLKRLNLIQDEQLFRYYVRYLGVDAGLEAGEYDLRGDMTMAEIVAKLQHGMARALNITIPEGWRLEQIAQLSAREGIADEAEFLRLAQEGSFAYDFLEDRPPGSPSGLEGYLFPETYQVVEGTGTRGFIDLLLRTFDQKLTPAMRQRASEQRNTIYEVVTLASIVEREAVADEERPIIASVYVNRINRGMYLQADPTVQYAKGYSAETGLWWNHMLLEEAQTVKSSYNTFLHPGLPPGPICNPGIASIEAVLYPAETPYLFFFSKGDGTHAFSETYEEHLENMRKYQQ
jgi:UPF0755 protein